VNLAHEFYLEDELKSNDEETIGELDDAPIDKIKRWKRALDNGTSDPMYLDIDAMERFNMSWDELMRIPEHVFLSMDRIQRLKAKHAMAQQQAREY